MVFMKSVDVRRCSAPVVHGCGFTFQEEAAYYILGYYIFGHINKFII